MHITYLSIYLSFYHISIYITLINIQNTYKTYTSSKKSETLLKKNGKGLYKLKILPAQPVFYLIHQQGKLLDLRTVRIRLNCLNYLLVKAHFKSLC